MIWDHQGTFSVMENVHFWLVSTTVYMRVVNKTFEGRKNRCCDFLFGSLGVLRWLEAAFLLYSVREDLFVHDTSWTLLNALPREENNPLMALIVWLLVFQPLSMHCRTGSALRSLLYELVDQICSLDLKLKTLFEPATLIILNSPCTAALSLLHRHDS